MKLYITRHGLTKHNKLGTINGQSIDEGLEPEGFEQASLVVSQLPEGICRIFSSDMLRTRQTTKVINEHLKLPVLFHPDLREVHFGRYAGMSWADVKNTYGENEHEKYVKKEYDFTPHGGESFKMVTERLEKILSELKQKHPDEKILVVTHGGIIRAMYHLFNKPRLDKVENVSVHEFEI